MARPRVAVEAIRAPLRGGAIRRSCGCRLRKTRDARRFRRQAGCVASAGTANASSSIRTRAPGSGDETRGRRRHPPDRRMRHRSSPPALRAHARQTTDRRRGCGARGDLPMAPAVGLDARRHRELRRGAGRAHAPRLRRRVDVLREQAVDPRRVRRPMVACRRAGGRVTRRRRALHGRTRTAGARDGGRTRGDAGTTARIREGERSVVLVVDRRAPGQCSLSTRSSSAAVIRSCARTARTTATQNSVIATTPTPMGMKIGMRATLAARKRACIR